MSRITTLDERLRERAAAEWKTKVEAIVAGVREKCPAHITDPTKGGKLGRLHGLRVRVNGDDRMLEPTHVEVSISAALQMLEAAMIAGGTPIAQDAAVTQFLARVDRIQVDLEDVRAIAQEAHRHD